MSFVWTHTHTHWQVTLTLFPAEDVTDTGEESGSFRGYLLVALAVAGSILVVFAVAVLLYCVRITYRMSAFI